MAFDGATIIEIWSSDEEQSPPLKQGKKKDEKSMFEDNDCFILDFDPFDEIDLSKKLAIADDNDAQEISIVAERGPVACRDFPHSRHLCVKFPFNQTPHERFCKLCYCYVCDMPAPCKYWRANMPEHCNASDQDPMWKVQRNVFVGGKLEATDHQILKHSNGDPLRGVFAM